jgi:hypothetical protein
MNIAFVDLVGLCFRCQTRVLAVISIQRSVLVIARERKQVTNPLKFIAILPPFISTRVPSSNSLTESRSYHLLSFVLPDTKSKLVYCSSSPYRYKNKVDRQRDLIGFRRLQTVSGLKPRTAPQNLYLYHCNLVRRWSWNDSPFLLFSGSVTTVTRLGAGQRGFDSQQGR